MNKLIILVLVLLIGCAPHPMMIPDADPDPVCPFYVPEKIRVALVLGSGGVRGMAHVGVIEELEKAGIPIDIIIGCSAGSIVGALYADHPDIEAVKWEVGQIRANSLLDINILRCRYGLCKGTTIKHVIDCYLHARTFEELKIPLVIVASDLHSGELIPFGAGPLPPAIQASCSIPFIFSPCKHMGRIFVDGGVINPVPTKVARDLGASIVIAVDLSELLPKTFPTNLFEITTRSAEIAFMWQNEVCTRKADIVIRPKTRGVGTFNDNMKTLLYKAGKAAALEQIPLIQEMIALHPIDEDGTTKQRLVSLSPYTPQIYLEPIPEETSTAIAEVEPETQPTK